RRGGRVRSEPVHGVPPDLPATGLARPGGGGSVELHPLSRLLHHSGADGRRAPDGRLGAHRPAGDEAEPVEPGRGVRRDPAAPDVPGAGCAGVGAQAPGEDAAPVGPTAAGGGTVIELPATRSGSVARTVTATVVLLFLALPLAVIIVTSFGADGVGSFP